MLLADSYALSYVMYRYTCVRDYLHDKFHTPSSNSSLGTVTKPNIKCSYGRHAAVLVLKKYLNKR